MTTIQTQKQSYTPSEYLALEEVAAFRSEYKKVQGLVNSYDHK